MITLLSPAKSLNPVDETINGTTTPNFNKEAQELIAILKEKSVRDIANMMDLSENLANLNYDRYKFFKSRYTSKNSAAAMFLFAGDVYRGLDAKSWSDEEIESGNTKIRILSGLYGLLKPMDKVQPYRLEMGTKLNNTKGTNLYRFWGDSIAKRINTDLRGHKEKKIVNLASKEYFTAVDKSSLKYPIIEIDFKEWRNDKLKIISFNAKVARGLMAKYIVQNNIETSDGLSGFSEDGYKLHESSTSNQLLFIR